jgi:hypothetical protein
MYYVSAAHNLGYFGVVMVLVETPLGFAIFYFDGVSLYEPDAMEVLAQHCSLFLRH